MLISSLALATQASVEVSSRSAADVAKLKGMAASLNPFFRTVGQALGIVIGQAAFTNQMRGILGAPAALEAAELAQIIRNLPPMSTETGLYRWAFSESLDVVWWILFALAALFLVISLATKDTGLSRRASVSLASTVESHDLKDMKDAKDLGTNEVTETSASDSPTGSSRDDASS